MDIMLSKEDETEQYNTIISVDERQNVDIDTLEIIPETIPVEMINKDKYGEVETPISVINEMLDRLDTEYQKKNVIVDTIFSNPNLRWFEPACGKGVFIRAIYMRLLEGLSVAIPSEEDRKTHILQKMLYMSELNTTNVAICQQLFAPQQINIHSGDTLSMNINEKWNVDKFDIIIGNPPYNLDGVRSCTGKRMTKQIKTIWAKFIETAFKCWLKPTEGILAFITPLSWLKNTHTLHDLMLQQNIVWLKLWDNAQSMSVMNCLIPISIFILFYQPPRQNKTEINSILRNRRIISVSYVVLDPLLSIPLAHFSLFEKLRNFIRETNTTLEIHTKCVEGEGDKIHLETIPPERMDGLWGIDTYTKKGIFVRRMTDIHPHTFMSKLILANKSGLEGAFIDNIGSFGLTGNHKYYILGERLEILEEMFQFKMLQNLCHFMKYSQDFLDKEIFHFIPDLRKFPRELTESDFYRVIGATTTELEAIL